MKKFFLIIFIFLNFIIKAKNNFFDRDDFFYAYVFYAFDIPTIFLNLGKIMQRNEIILKKATINITEFKEIYENSYNPNYKSGGEKDSVIILGKEDLKVFFYYNKTIKSNDLKSKIFHLRRYKFYTEDTGSNIIYAHSKYRFYVVLFKKNKIKRIIKYDKIYGFYLEISFDYKNDLPGAVHYFFRYDKLEKYDTVKFVKGYIPVDYEYRNGKISKRTSTFLLFTSKLVEFFDSAGENINQVKFYDLLVFRLFYRGYFIGDKKDSILIELKGDFDYENKQGANRILKTTDTIHFYPQAPGFKKCIINYDSSKLPQKIIFYYNLFLVDPYFEIFYDSIGNKKYLKRIACSYDRKKYVNEIDTTTFLYKRLFYYVYNFRSPLNSYVNIKYKIKYRKEITDSNRKNNEELKEILKIFILGNFFSC